MFKAIGSPISTILCFFLLLTLTAVQAQKKLTMSDAITLERSQFRPTSLSQLQWTQSDDFFTYVANQKLVKASAKKPLAVDSIDVLPAINRALFKMQSDTLKTIPTFSWQKGEIMRFSNGAHYYDFDLKKGNLSEAANTPDDAENQDLHPVGNKVAYTKDGALWIADGTSQIEVVRSEADGIVYGKSVHREEFGIFKGTYWSQDASQLAFYRMDESMVTQYPIYVLDSMPAAARYIHYPFAGSKSHHVTIGVYDLKTKHIVYLQTGEPAEQYLTNVEWTPDNKAILVAVVNREQNHMWLRKFDATSGAFLATLFEEKNDIWVEPEHPVAFLKDGSNRFIWQSERDGFNHLYLYAADGKLIRQLTKGNRVVTENLGPDAKSKYIYYQWADSTGLNRYISRVNLDSGAEQAIAIEPGTHTAKINPNSNWILDEFTSLTVPRTIEVRQTADPKRKTLIHAAPDPTKGYAFGKCTITSYPTPSGFDLNARTILPPDFNPAKKYPALVYVYNGPHVQLVTNSWMGAANLWMQRLAQEGYVIYTIDGRGSGNRSFAFESNIHRQLGTNEVADQLFGVKQLLKSAYIDSTRVGVYGWSFGGFMTTSLLTRPEAKGVFKCGVAGGAVTDWSMYEIMYTERYMDRPQENPDGYQAASTFTYLPNLSVPFLMIHGSSDNVVVWQHTLRYARECVKNGIQLEYFMYPEHEHNVRGKERVHLFEKIEGFLKREL